MKTKVCPVKIKAAGEHEGTDAGEFEALVSVFDNVDFYGDVVHKGAFVESLKTWADSGDPIPVIWSHQHDDPDSHIGEVLSAEETDEGLLVKGKLDLDEPRAAKVWKLLKGRRVKNFSFAYDMEYEENKQNEHGGFDLNKLHVFEVGPTLIGANTSTDLLAVKKAIASHETATSDSEWDGPANEARLSTDAGAEVYRQAYAWADPDADADTKAAYKFIHHEVSEDGSVGAANLQACVTAIGVLNGGRGGADIPDADVQGVYSHLAKHLTDADMEPPALAGTSSAPARGEKAGRVLSSKNEQALKEALDKFSEGVALMKNVLAAVNSGQEDDEKQATPPTAARDEEPPEVKSPAPGPGPASLRQLTDLTALEAEVESLTG